MYRNYFLFAEQVRWLNEEITSAVIEGCFTHRKSELVLQIQSDAVNFLRIGLQPSLPYILLSTVRNIKEAKIEFFQEITGQEIESIKIQPFDKLINIKCPDYYFKVHFYGSQPNVILFDRHGNEIDKFKKDKKTVVSSKQDIILNPFECDDNSLAKLIIDDPKWTIEKFLSHHVGGFNLLLARECCFRAKLKNDLNLQLLQAADLQMLSKCTKQIAIETRSAEPIIYFKDDIPKHISIIRLHHLKKTFATKIYQNVNEAWKEFLRLRFEKEKIEKIITQNRKAIEKKINYIEKSLKKAKEFEELEARKKFAELKGNLLLTFISEIPRGAGCIKLKNIFSEKQEKIEIKLNPSKSVQENAQKYFMKFKDIETQKNRVENKKYMLQRELKDITVLKKKSDSIKSMKEAVKLYNILIQRKIIQKDNFDETKVLNMEYSFKRWLLDKKWEIYVGKNDKNNDLLTFKFAHKFDLWFHAQGVPGSHVIIRLSGKDEMPPGHIIEQTAAIAAFHSASKHSSTVPVIYSQVRYVRKPRKAKQGTVSVLQHKTIFIEPKIL